MTEPLLNQLDPRSLFGAGSEKTPTASTGGHSAIKHAAGVADDVGLRNDNVVKALSKAVWHRLRCTDPKCHSLAMRQGLSVQGVISTVTYTLTHSIFKSFG